MKKYLAEVRNEWAKLMARKKYLVLLIIAVALGLVNILGKSLLARVSVGAINLRGSSAPMAMITLYMDFLIPLVVMMAVCDLFSTEFQDQTIKAVLLRPVSRFKIYAAKVTAAALLALAYLTVLFGASVLLDLLISHSAGNAGYAFGAYYVDLAPLLVVIFMAAFINQFGKSSTMAMFLCIIVYVLLYIAGILIPNLSGMLFTGYMKWHTIWLGHRLPVGALAAKTGLLAGYGLLFFSGGYLLFLRREV